MFLAQNNLVCQVPGCYERYFFFCERFRTVKTEIESQKGGPRSQFRLVMELNHRQFLFFSFIEMNRLAVYEDVKRFQDRVKVVLAEGGAVKGTSSLLKEIQAWLANDAQRESGGEAVS